MGADASGGVVGVVAGDSEGGAVGFFVVGDHLGEREFLEEVGGHWGDYKAAI